MIIYCTTHDEFYDSIKRLTENGLGFNAYVDKLEICLTGGY